MKWNQRTKKSCLKFFRSENVVGTGLGYKEKEGVRINEPSLVFLVKKKLPEEKLTPMELIPKTVDEMITDVIEVGELTFFNRTGKMRPAKPGVSIGHIDTSAGTFGALVQDLQGDKKYILSNNHVLANLTDGRDGRASIGDPVLQPGRYDGGTGQDVLGYLYKFVPLYRELEEPSCPVAVKFQKTGQYFLSSVKSNYRIELYKITNTENTVDAALAEPAADNMVQPEILEVGVPMGTAQAVPGMNVLKSGRTTGLTRGVVTVIEATLRITVGEGSSVILSEQIVCSAMGAPGDSGSLILDEKLQAVGLLCAGSNQVTVANNISNVLSMLEVVLVTKRTLGKH